MIKPIKAYAIVKTKNPHLKALEIYAKKDGVVLMRDEKFVRVEIRVV